ncbi:MAG: hypothetical protein RKO24_04310, partial [Candidatus Competibacter sp.]|nr:hypothetical protein [Candidatus Competibacter sp.]
WYSAGGRGERTVTTNQSQNGFEVESGRWWRTIMIGRIDRIGGIEKVHDVTSLCGAKRGVPMSMRTAMFLVAIEVHQD